MVHDYQVIQKSGFSKGRQRQIPTYGKCQGVKLIGTLNDEAGEILCVEEETYNVEVFLRFFEKVLTYYLHGKITMVLDNSQMHHAKLIRPFLMEDKN